MAFIEHLPDEDIPEAERVPDSDNILRIHGVHGLSVYPRSRKVALP